MASEFTIKNCGPITRLAPTTPRAQAWLDFHGLRSVIRRAYAVAAGARTLPDVLTQLLIADISGQNVEPQLVEGSPIPRGEMH